MVSEPDQAERGSGTPAVVEQHSDWLNRFTRTRGSDLGHQDWVIARHSK